MVRFVSILEDLKEGRIQFVDLNLPSATKWAFTDVPRYFSLEEAIEQNESIPTIEQYKELFTNCRFSVLSGSSQGRLIAESLNGRHVCFDCRGHFLQKIIIGYVYLSFASS